MAELIRLRDLPGMQRIIELAANPAQHNPNMRTLLDEEIDALSIRLFRITEWDTYFFEYESDDGEEAGVECWSNDNEEEDETVSDEELERWEQFDASLLNCSRHYDETKPFWELLGWDISDGKGEEMVCAHRFLRQILAVHSGIVEGAQFCPLADGKRILDAQDVESLEARLGAEAQAFYARRGR